MGYLISAIEVTDYKRVRKVVIKPDADAHVIFIGGKNTNGKSSTLDALTAAFGGGRSKEADPVRHGAKEATIFVELDGGRLTIDRTIAPDGKQVLELRDPDGVIRSPQAMLDKLVGAARFLDPLAFLALPAKEQRARLMQLIPDAARIVDLDERRTRAFDRRTELGREKVKADGELARLPVVDEIPTPIDVAALSLEQQPLVELARVTSDLGAQLSIAIRNTAAAVEQLEHQRKAIAETDAQIVEIQRRLDAQRARVPDLEAQLEQRAAAERAAKDGYDKAAVASTAATTRRLEIERELARADAHNRGAVEAEVAVRRREEAAAAVAKNKTDYDACTAALETIDARKLAILTAAKLPVEGLTIDAEQILLNGVAFAQASGAEKLRVSLALAMAGSEIDDVWIKDAAILDDESLLLVIEQAKTAGKRVWLEVVSARAPGTIEIRDGEVVE